MLRLKVDFKSSDFSNRLVQFDFIAFEHSSAIFALIVEHTLSARIVRIQSDEKYSRSDATLSCVTYFEARYIM